MSTQYHIIYNRTESNLVKLLRQLAKLTIKRNNDLLILKKVAKYFITADYNSGLNQVKSDFEALTYDDVKNLSNKFESDTFDIITCNPPYFKDVDTSKKNDDIHKIIARHEVNLNMDDIAKVVRKLLKNDGKLLFILLKKY